jgi:hypothetical protein
MKSDSVQIDKIKTYLLEVLRPLVDSKSTDWIQLQKQRIEEDSSYLKFYVAFGQASRYFKKNPLVLSEAQIQEADKLLTGFSPASWDLLQAARTYLLLHFTQQDSETYVSSLTRLFETADMHEQQALYAALPLLPYQEALVDRAMEGLRTNIVSVFDAVALNNPYPAKYFDDRAWNQMVIKAIFLQRPLYQIQQADQRANQQLADILVDYAHERWAAGREVVPELWRFVGPFLQTEHEAEIGKVIETGDALQVKAAVLACSQCSLPFAQQLLSQHENISTEIRSGVLNWDAVGIAYLTSKSS